jgi:hypothetical protein
MGYLQAFGDILACTCLFQMSDFRPCAGGAYSLVKGETNRAVALLKSDLLKNLGVGNWTARRTPLATFPHLARRSLSENLFRDEVPLASS